MVTISTKDYLLDQAKRRLTPTPVTIPGMGAIEKRLLQRDWDQFPLAQPPAGSELKPVTGDGGLPVLGHMIEMFRGGPDFVLHTYRKYGPLHYVLIRAIVQSLPGAIDRPRVLVDVGCGTGAPR